MRSRAWLRIFVVLVGALFLSAMAHMGLFDLAVILRGAGNLLGFVGGMFPPDLAVLPTLAWAALETLEIALVGTLLGFIAAMPLSLLATPTVFGPRVAAPLRLVLAAVRTVPSLLWAVVFVVAVGLGPAAGALGIALYSLGYMGKLFCELFEGVDPEVLEAVRGVGCGPWQLARFVILPEAANGVLAQLLFMFEYNVRASSIMGFVGAGGIGFYMLGYIQMLRYDQLMTALAVTLVLVLAIEWLSSKLRAAVLWEPSTAAPASTA